MVQNYVVCILYVFIGVFLLTGKTRITGRSIFENYVNTIHLTKSKLFHYVLIRDWLLLSSGLVGFDSLYDSYSNTLMIIYNYT